MLKEESTGHWPGAQGVETEYQRQSEEMCPSPEDLTAPKGELGKKLYQIKYIKTYITFLKAQSQ